MAPGLHADVPTRQPCSGFATSSTSPAPASLKGRERGSVGPVWKKLPARDDARTRSHFGSGSRCRSMLKSIAPMMPSPNSSWISAFSVAPYRLTSLPTAYSGVRARVIRPSKAAVVHSLLCPSLRAVSAHFSPFFIFAAMMASVTSLRVRSCSCGQANGVLQSPGHVVGSAQRRFRMRARGRATAAVRGSAPGARRSPAPR